MNINTLKTDSLGVQTYAPIKKQTVSQSPNLANAVDSEVTAKAPDTVELSLKAVNFSKAEIGVNAPEIGSQQQARQLVDSIITQIRGNPRQALAAFSNL